MERHPEEYKEACLALENYLLDQFLPGESKEGFRVSAYAFKDEDGGIRISEIDLHTQRSGEVWQRSEDNPYTLGLLLAAEDFILHYEAVPYKPAGWQSEINLAEDAKWKLSQVIQKMRE